MNLKSYLKPTISRIIISIILFYLISYYSPCYYHVAFPQPDRLSAFWQICRNDAFDILFGNFVLDSFPYMWGVFWYTGFPISLIPLFIIIALSYLLAPIIIKIYDFYKNIDNKNKWKLFIHPTIPKIVMTAITIFLVSHDWDIRYRPFDIYLPPLLIFSYILSSSVFSLIYIIKGRIHK